MRWKTAKHIIDILLGVGFLLLMSYQVTGDVAHEWTGIVMTLILIAHQALNWKWYLALFKGTYTPLRIVQTAVNAALIVCFILTALSGVNMSVHAVPFLGDFMRASLGRRLHLTLSHWCFVLMGLHLGLHLPAMLRGVRGKGFRRAGWCASILAAGAGLWLFLKNNYPDYLLYRVPFAFIDYDKAAALVLLEALAIAFFWVFAGSRLPGLLNRKAGGKGRMAAALGVLLAIAVGVGLMYAPRLMSADGETGDAIAPWSAESQSGEERPSTTAVPAENEEQGVGTTIAEEGGAAQVEDGFLWLEGGAGGGRISVAGGRRLPDGQSGSGKLADRR